MAAWTSALNGTSPGPSNPLAPACRGRRQRGVAPPGRPQLGIGSALDDAAALEHGDLVEGVEPGERV